jgi:3-oxoacyl-[acyl-carrier protein] reductase
MKLQGQVALVTGASRGIGRAISLALAADGAAVACNFRSGKAEAASLVKEIEEAGGKAIAVEADVADYEGAKNDVMRVNFGGVFNCTKAVMPHFMARGSGVIVNISSVMGERGWVGESNYAASKGAVNAFTRCCAMELARFGVRVNAVLPGFAPTGLVAELLEKDGGKGIKRQIPMRSFATVKQVADAVVFLAGPGASYMTGTLVPVDGGASTALGLGAPL